MNGGCAGKRLCFAGKGRAMEIQILEGGFSVCQMREIGPEVLKQEFCFVGRTDEELSLVCRTECVPEQALRREDGWKGFRIQGELDFSLIGILARLSGILAEEGIGIFVVSTYRTDYLFTKREAFGRAIAALERNGVAVQGR